MLAVSDTKAAKMLDLSTAEFRRLVRAGSLPPCCMIGEHERWYVDDLRATLKGKPAWGDDEEIEV